MEKRFGVTLANGDMIDCDAVVAGVGAVPETTIAAEAGLAIDNGIAVDATFRTSRPRHLRRRRLLLRSRFRITAAGAFALNPGATLRTKGPRQRGQCSVRANPIQRYPGSGLTNTTRRCRSPACPTKAGKPSRATSAMRASSFTLPTTAAWSPRAPRSERGDRSGHPFRRNVDRGARRAAPADLASPDVKLKALLKRR